MFKEASRHNWHLFSTVWVSKLICLQKYGERECLRVIVPPTTLRVLISGWAPSHPPPPAAFFYVTKSRGFFCSPPYIQTSTLKNPFSLIANTSSNDTWSRTQSSPESVMIMKTIQSPPGPYTNRSPPRVDPR